MLNRTHILQNMLLLCCMLLLAACHNNDFPKPEGGASLHLNLKGTESDIVTRGVEDLNDDGTISEEEKIIDGGKMYRLAVFLLYENTIVSSTVLEADDPRFTNGNTEANVSFIHLDYSKVYKLYAVANYGNYGTLEGNLQNVNESNVTSGLTVTASDGNICNSKTPYPLTLSRDINLTPGINSISGELLRTYARIRINIRNQSSLNNLYITKLNFAQKFTQSSARLFATGGTASVTPTATSANAITSFVQNVMIPKLEDNGAVSEKTIFDAYLLESTGGTYNYTLGLKYQSEEEEVVYTVSSTAINNHNNIEDNSLYVIYNTTAKKYLYANGSSVSAGDSYLNNGELNHNYVWKFNKTSGKNYTIESMGATGYFMQSAQVSTNKIPLTVNPGNSDYVTASTNNNNIRFQTTKMSGRNYLYLAVNNNTPVGSTNSNNSYFNLYKVEKTNGVSSITHEETIPIHIVDKNTGEASALTAINRNDFIDILVSVTYNEKSGNMQFEVSNWDEVNGEVTFD